MNHCKLTLFEKSEGFGIVVLDQSEEKGIHVGTYDGRYRRGKRNSYEGIYEANETYYEAIEKTVNSGWEIVYKGERNFG